MDAAATAVFRVDAASAARPPPLPSRLVQQLALEQQVVEAGAGPVPAHVGRYSRLAQRMRDLDTAPAGPEPAGLQPEGVVSVEAVNLSAQTLVRPAALALMHGHALHAEERRAGAAEAVGAGSGTTGTGAGDALLTQLAVGDEGAREGAGSPALGAESAVVGAGVGGRASPRLLTPSRKHLPQSPLEGGAGGHSGLSAFGTPLG